MSTIKFGTGTFIVREEASRDLFGVMEKIARIGYDGLELLGFFSQKPEAIRKKADELSLQILGDHVQADTFLADPEQVINDHITLGVDYITIAWPANTPRLPGMLAYQDMLTKIAGLCSLCVKARITPLFHNHGGDFEGHPTHYETILDACADVGMRAEPDIGWMYVAGVDVPAYLQKYRDRTPVIHLKDVYYTASECLGDRDHLPAERGDSARGGFEFRPTGYGIVENAVLMAHYLRCNPKWFVIDHDCAYDRDPYEDLRISLAYTRHLLSITEGMVPSV